MRFSIIRLTLCSWPQPKSNSWPLSKFQSQWQLALGLDQIPSEASQPAKLEDFRMKFLAINSINTTYVKHYKTMSCICTCGSFFDVSGILSFRWEVTSGTCRETYHGIL
jgi:hypothetical protein